MKLTLLIIVALLCACIPARAGTKEPWLNDPAILFSTRITVAGAFVLDAHEIVVSDDQRRLWLLILRDGKPEGRFFYSQVLGLQASFCDNGAVYYIIVPPLGYKWQIPLKKHQTLGAISDLRHPEERSASLPFRTLKRLPAESALALNRFYEPSRHNGRNSSDSFWASTVVVLQLWIEMHVENRRCGGGKTVQRRVLYLGEINDSQRESWCRTIEVFGRAVLLHHPRLLSGLPFAGSPCSG